MIDVLLSPRIWLRFGRLEQHLKAEMSGSIFRATAATLDDYNSDENRFEPCVG